MSDLTEREILDCLYTNLKSATQNCRLLAELPMRGPTYNQLRKELKLIEGACRQIAHWREDSRWLQIGLLMEECHRRSGTWLRKFAPRPLFILLATNLCSLFVICNNLETKKTGIRGAILPEENTIPTQFRKNSSGLILPSTM